MELKTPQVFPALDLPRMQVEARDERDRDQVDADARRARALDDPSWDLHEAAYFGRLDVVTRLLDGGADPNEAHAPNPGWVCGPTPLNKAIVAWHVSPAHVAIAELLIARGARVDESHFNDSAADSVGSPEDAAILSLLERHRPR